METYIIRAGIVAELVEDKNGEFSVGNYEPIATFMQRNNTGNEFFMEFSTSVRYCSVKEKSAVVVTEDAPCYRTINESAKAVNYPIPWCYTVQRYLYSNKTWMLNEMMIGISGQRIAKITEGVIYALPLPNIFTDKRVCFGDTSFPTCGDLGAMVCRPIETFWGSEFTREAMPAKSSFFATKANWRRMKLDTVCGQEFKNPAYLKNILNHA